MEIRNIKEELKIIEYSDELKHHIKEINYDWLNEYFQVEEMDAIMLSDPRRYIIDKGGYIFYARLHGEITGTAALLKVKEGVYELAKMGVYKQFRGVGIGTALLEHCLAFAERLNIHTLVLYSSRRLKNALHLYEKYGFKEVEYEGGYYARGDIKMERRLG